MLFNTTDYLTVVNTYIGPRLHAMAANKSQALERAFLAEEYAPQTVLFPCFSLAAVGLADIGYDVTVCIDTNSAAIVAQQFPQLKVTKQSLLELADANQKFDAVIAVDEYITYAEFEEQQIALLHALLDVAEELVLVSVRDYKNMPQHNYQFDEPFGFSKDNNDVTVLHRRTWKEHDRQAWQSQWYVVNSNNQQWTSPLIDRRTMYFKQLAKFSHDYGIDRFTVLKGASYKPAFSKHYEFLAGIRL